MLLRLTSPDIHDTELVDCASGETLYRTFTPVASSSRSRSNSCASSTSGLSSYSSLWSRSNRSLEKIPECAPHATAVLDTDGEAVAEITWEGRNAAAIRIRDEVLRGTTELFDAAFVRVFPDETYLPTRMEYTWRITPESLTLLDDDDVVIGKLHSNCSLVMGRPVPMLQVGQGEDYLEIDNIPLDELLEVILTYLLVTTLRERLYSVAEYVCGRRKSSLANLRLHASRSFANLRNSLRRVIVPAAAHH